MKDLKILFSNDVLNVSLPKEIDHHSAQGIREKIDEALYLNRPSEVVISLREVSFMDSSCIGLVMGRYKTINELDGELAIINTSPGIGKVMRLAGMERLAKIGMEELANETN